MHLCAITTSSHNRKNGTSRKTMKSASGNFELSTPRDRSGSFEPQLIKKHPIVVGAGVVDQEKELKWRPEMEQVYKYRIPHYATEKKKAFEKRSVINWVNELPRGMPILLLHGDADKRVNVENARDLAAELTKLKHPHELKIYSKGDHSLRKNRKDVNSRVIAWFTKHLNNP